MRIQHNIMAMNAYRNYTNNVSAMKANLEKLSSGYKINRAGDDAAGLAISEKMRAQITGLETAQKNAKDGISLVQTAEGALTEVHDMLNRMVELASQSANGTYDVDTDRAQMQKEIEQLTDEINRIADSSNFNGIKLLDGTMDAGGTSTTVDGLDRILEGSTGKATGKGVADVGTKTILDGGAAAKDVKTEFKVDFNGMTASLSAAGGAGGGTPASFKAADTLPNGVKSVTGTAPADATDGDVKVAVTFATANTGASANGADGLAGLTFTDADDQGNIGNGINIKIVADSGGTEGAAWDDTTKTLTVTLDGTNGSGTGGAYTASDIETLIKGAGDKSGNDGIDFSNFTVTGTAEVDAGTDGELGATALAGGADTGDATVTLSGGITGTKTVKAADWTGDVAVAVNGMTVTFDSTVLDGTTDLTASDIGTATAAQAGGGGGGAAPTNVKFSVKLNGEDLATDVEVADKADAKAIAAAVLAKLGAGSTSVDIGVDGGTYTVTDNGDGSLKFVLNEDPTADNIKGNFTWDISVADGSITGAHTGGTQVTKAGSVASAAMTANTVFEIKAADITDGTEITIDGKTVTLAVGASSTLSGSGVVDLKDMEAGTIDLDVALGRISQAMGDTTNFIVGVNNGGDDSTSGLTVQKKDGSKNTYDTMEKLAEVFSMKTKSAVNPNGGLTLQIGDTADSFNQLKVSIRDMHADKLGIGKSQINIKDQASAAKAVDAIKDAINQVSDVRGTLGATQNRLDHTINNLSVMTENIQDAESTIRDVDIAEEMMAYTKNNILIQSAQAMLAQANQVPQGVLQLLG